MHTIGSMNGHLYWHTDNEEIQACACGVHPGLHVSITCTDIRGHNIIAAHADDMEAGENASPCRPRLLTEVSGSLT